MKEPREWLMVVINDPYATDESKKAACKLYNGMRRQMTRRKRLRARLDALAPLMEERR